MDQARAELARRPKLVRHRVCRPHANFPPKLQSADLLLQKNFDTPQFAAMVEEFAGIFIGSDLLIESVA
jgi:hypothetical protein